MKKLRPIADINLPNFPEDIDEVYILHPPITARVDKFQIVPTPPVWEDTQESQEDPAVDPPPWSSPTPVPSRHRDRTASPMVDLLPSSRDFLTRLREASSKATKPKARLKHLDSQLDFAPITADSQIPAMDSQLLTEHQREVRDRQQGEAANLFSEIGVEQIPRHRKEIPSVKGPIEKMSVSEQIPQHAPPDRSPSIDEFVDAPEGNVNEASKRDDDYADEIEFVPATAFTVQVPKRVRPDKKPERRVGAGPSNTEPSQGQGILGDEKRGELEVSSKYFTVPKRNRESWKTKELSVENNTQAKQMEQYDNEEIVPVTYRSTPKELEDTKEDTNPEAILDSLEIHRIPDTPLPAPEIVSNKDQSPMSEREQENIVVEVPDSFVQDNGEGRDVRMIDSYEAPDEQETEKHTTTQTNTEDSQAQESLQLSVEVEKGTTKRGEAYDEMNVGEIRTSKPGPSEKRHRVRPRRSLQIQTTTSKTEGVEGDNTILDCIMVTPATPRKEPFPIVPETVLRKDTSPKLPTGAPPPDSPLSRSTISTSLAHVANIFL